MRYLPIDPQLFITHRERLRKLMLKNSLAVINANDVPPTNADGTLALRQNSDLFYLTGIEQEETILLLYPDADAEEHREVLFLREREGGSMDCRCDTVTELYESEAEQYAADHLHDDGDTSFSCPDTGARWQIERGEQTRLVQTASPGLTKEP